MLFLKEDPILMALRRKKKEENEANKADQERSPVVAKKDEKHTEEVAQETPQPETTDLPEEDQKALVRISANLPAPIQTSVQRLMTVMNPEKKGFEEMGGARWSPPVVKVRQGTSSDAPEKTKLGEMYTNNGMHIGDRFEFVPLYLYKTRAKFEEGNPQPTCRSENAEVNVYGEPCAECPDAPFKQGQKTDCSESINALVFSEKFNEIYHLQFQKTSYRAGYKLFRQAGSGVKMWEKWFALKTEERQSQRSPNKYFVFTITPTGEELDMEYHPVSEFFYTKIVEARNAILSRIEEKGESAKKLVDKLDKTTFGGGEGGEGGGTADAPEPDFSGSM